MSKRPWLQLRRTPRFAALAALSVVALAFAGLAAGATSGSARVAAGTATGLPLLPKNVRPWYKAAGVPIVVSPYHNFKAKSKPPWTIGYASTYSGNTWRDRVLETYQQLAAKYKRLGLVKNLVVTQSEGDVGRTIQQFRQLIDQGADGMLTIGPSATGINGAIRDAFNRGIPVVNQDAPVSSPYAINTGVNYPLAGRQMAKWLIKRMGGKGNVLMVNGIPGVSSSDQIRDGALSVLKSTPGINIVGQVNGLWTTSIAKAETLKFLGTHPGKIDGVVNNAIMGVGIVEAFEQVGRPLPPITVVDAQAELAYWRDHPNYADTGFSIFPPRDGAELAWNVLMRTMEGQGPKIASIVRPAAKIKFKDLKTLAPAGTTTKSVYFANALPGTWFPSTLLDKFFKRPADPAKFKA